VLSLSPTLIRQAALHPAVLAVLVFTALWLALKAAGVDYLGLLVALGWTTAGLAWLVSTRYIALQDREQMRAIRRAHALKVARQIGAEMPLMRCPAGCEGCAREYEQDLLARAVRHGHVPGERVPRPGLSAA
jgi:hypothetical protein